MTEPTTFSSWRRPMLPRSTDEPHRSATVLELFFDLCFVVAIAQAAEGLHHAVSEDHVADGVTGYLMVFFAIWWAWMNFTWFASAYDTDDVPYRLTTLVQITGALVLAAGVSRAMTGRDFTVITIGYVIMRLAMVTQWLRAAHHDPAHRATCRRYALGITLVQALWVIRLLLPHEWGTATFVLCAVADLAVPAWAERTSTTPWHPGHVTERYGLFTLIVLGESVLAATLAVEAALDNGGGDVELFSLAAAGLIIVFAMWWLYFARRPSALLHPAGAVTTLRTALTWGYGHYVVFAAAAAAGAGLAVSVDYGAHVAHVDGTVAGLATAVPVAAFVLSVWLLIVRPGRGSSGSVAFPVTAALILLAPFGPAPIHVIAVLMAALAVVDTVLARRAR